MSRRNVRHELRQLGSWHARDRKWIATLAPEPEELERRLPINFNEAEDDLGSLRYVYLQIEPGVEVMLLKYANKYIPGTTVWIPSEARGNGFALHELLDALHLPKSEVLSMAPDGS